MQCKLLATAGKGTDEGIIGCVWKSNVARHSCPLSTEPATAMIARRLFWGICGLPANPRHHK